MRRVRILTAFCCLTLFLAGSLLAQSLATLQGSITDETGGLLPGVTVVIRNVETGIERTVVTDEAGFYRAPLLPSGSYVITASLNGFQTVVRENIILLVAQVLDVNLTLGVAAVEETITVTAESPVVELSRSSAAKYVSEEEITSLPILGRDFTNFALLQPTVKTEPIRGGISLSGQKGISSGFAIDGTEAKSAFFGYGRGGEATENDGLVVAQDSVKEFQVITSAFAPEYGRNGGGYINVVTKSGTNDVAGTGFLFFRDESLAEDLIRTDLDKARGISQDDPRFDPTEFERFNWGGSIGGPIKTDKTHFFFSYDQSSRDQPFVSNILGRGQYDAVLSRFPSLLRGFEPNDDGIAAPNADLGRTASGRFITSVDNLILFGKLNHQIDDNNSFSVRYNFTDFERGSDLKSQESLKTEETQSFVASLVSIFGTNAVNEFRFQFAKDNLDRLSNLESGDIVANFRIERPSFTSFGKPDFLPIFVREEKFQLQDNFSYHFGDHDLKFGLDLNIDNLSEFFAGSFDGRYDFRTIDDFLANNARRVRIWFADIDPPPAVNFDVTQQTFGVYAQDSWRAGERMTVNYGFRWDGTLNPGDLEHALPEGREVPDDLDNFAPRVGFTYS
ncbi:MAG: carboxypeptidase regulatory-like domain-containing protein, partial [Acidobacteriota bacterium]